GGAGVGGHAGGGAGVGGHAGGGAGRDGGAGGGAGAPPLNLQRGEVRVIEGADGFTDVGTTVVEHPYGRIDGRFYATHPPVWHTDVMTNGTCTLKKFVPSQCPA